MKLHEGQTKPRKKENERAKELKTVRVLIRRYEKVLEKGSDEKVDSWKGSLLQQEMRLERLLLLSKTAQNALYPKGESNGFLPKQRLRVVGEGIAFEKDLSAFKENEGRILAEEKEIKKLKQRCNALPEMDRNVLQKALSELKGLEKYLLRGGDTVRDIIGHTVSAIVSITLATLALLNPSIFANPAIVETSPISTFIFSGGVCYLISFNLLIMGSFPYLNNIYLARKEMNRTDGYSYEKRILTPPQEHGEIEGCINRMELEQKTWGKLETYLKGLLKNAQN